MQAIFGGICVAKSTDIFLVHLWRSLLVSLTENGQNSGSYRLFSKSSTKVFPFPNLSSSSCEFFEESKKSDRISLLLAYRFEGLLHGLSQHFFRFDLSRNGLMCELFFDVVFDVLSVAPHCIPSLVLP